MCALSGLEKVFFGNSGAEANEAAIKIARLYGHNKGIELPTIIVMSNSFHGRTIATVTATGIVKAQTGFAPLVDGFGACTVWRCGSRRRWRQLITISWLFWLSRIQGGSCGIRIPAADYLPQLRAICDQHDWLLMLDEIQAGLCRSGKWFAFQHSAIKPGCDDLSQSVR